MATYAIGDVQGCYTALVKLIEVIDFNPHHDRLWFVGDLVNRGPQSLETLRLVKNLKECAMTVLGNHDLHLLVVAAGLQPSYPDDTLDAILMAPDKDELLTWLRYRPLLHYDAKLNYVLVHAGLAWNWTLEQAALLAKEVEAALQHDSYRDFLVEMYGNEPNAWQDDLTGYARLRVTTNILTRMRFCDEAGHLRFDFKGKPEDAPPAFIPWFKLPKRVNKNERIVFGHWSALEGKTGLKNLFALDTGCVWGGRLTALRLEDQQLFTA